MRRRRLYFCNSFTAREGAGFDESGVGRDREIGNCCVLRLTRTVGNHRRIAGPFCHFDGVERFGDRTDLVELDQDGICNTLLNPFSRIFVFVTKRSSPTS